ncbi:MAG: serine/threonine protein kinase [Planctomycetota bacterium]|nr:MAG: serine/threonine protein kinase [Planctomycetota bacterium]
MKSFALKSRYWCSKCHLIHLPNEGSICPKCNLAMLGIELIANRYIFYPKNRLGKGVIKVWDQRMGRWTAIKFPQGKKEYKPNDSSSASFGRIDREILIQAQLEHPAIVSAYDVVEDPDYGKGLVMSLIEGISLYKLVSKHGPLRVRAAVEIMRDITGAVIHIHKKGIVHRDLTPGNIILEGKKPVLIDFGLAKFLSSPDKRDSGYLKARTIGGKELTVTKEGEILGTPLFMAPEQVEGSSGRVDERSDIYGLGATLYYIVTGKPPFSGKDVLSVISQVLHRDPLPPTQLNPMVDPPLEAIILKAMQKDREKRFQNAEEFYEALQSWLDGEELPAEIYKAPFLSRLGKALGKFRKAFLITLLVFTLIFTAASYFYSIYLKHLAVQKDIYKNPKKWNAILQEAQFNSMLELVDQLEKEKNPLPALALIQKIEKEWSGYNLFTQKISKKINQQKIRLEALARYQDKQIKGKDFWEKGKSLVKTEPEAALFCYLTSFDLLKEVYQERQDEKILDQLDKIAEEGKLFLPQNKKLAFKFYWSLFNSWKATFGSFPNLKKGNKKIQKLYYKLKHETDNLREGR